MVLRFAMVAFRFSTLPLISALAKLSVVFSTFVNRRVTFSLLSDRFLVKLATLFMDCEMAPLCSFNIDCMDADDTTRLAVVLLMLAITPWRLFLVEGSKMVSMFFKT